MAIGLVGRKCGMTRVFTDAGESVPVTVIEVLPNRVTQVKTTEKDGYKAVQVSYGVKRPQLVSKAVAGHYAKAGVAPGRALVEFRVDAPESDSVQVGAEFKADHFKVGQVFLCRTVLRARSASARRRVACSLASACPATWAPCAAPPRTSRLSRSTPSATCS